MSKTPLQTSDAIADCECSPAETARMGELLDILDDWKARVDDLWVQLDLGKLKMCEQAALQLELAHHVNQMTAPKLRDAYRDALENTEILRDGVESLLQDVKDVFDAVRGAMGVETGQSTPRPKDARDA